MTNFFYQNLITFNLDPLEQFEVLPILGSGGSLSMTNLSFIFFIHLIMLAVWLGLFNGVNYNFTERLECSPTLQERKEEKSAEAWRHFYRMCLLGVAGSVGAFLPCQLAFAAPGLGIGGVLLIGCVQLHNFGFLSLAGSKVVGPVRCYGGLCPSLSGCALHQLFPFQKMASAPMLFALITEDGRGITFAAFAVLCTAGVVGWGLSLPVAYTVGGRVAGTKLNSEFAEALEEFPCKGKLTKRAEFEDAAALSRSSREAHLRRSDEMHVLDALTNRIEEQKLAWRMLHARVYSNTKTGYDRTLTQMTAEQGKESIGLHNGLIAGNQQAQIFDRASIVRQHYYYSFHLERLERMRDADYADQLHRHHLYQFPTLHGTLLTRPEQLSVFAALEGVPVNVKWFLVLLQLLSLCLQYGCPRRYAQYLRAMYWVQYRTAVLLKAYASCLYTFLFGAHFTTYQSTLLALLCSVSFYSLTPRSACSACHHCFPSLLNCSLAFNWWRRHRFPDAV